MYIPRCMHNVHTYIYVCMHTYMHTHVHMYMYVYVCIYTYTYVCMFHVYTNLYKYYCTQNTTGEWECSEEIQSMFPGSGNNVLSHVVYHLHELHNPAKPCRPVSSLPNFSLKACCIGKPFAGKSTILKKVSKGTYIHICI